MPELTYHDKNDIENELKLRSVLNELPKFSKDFFRAIEPTTASRTRLAYAYDIRVFFEYIKDSNPDYKDTNISDFKLELLDSMEINDIEEYLDYLKIYQKNGVDHINKELGIKRKLSALRAFYNYFANNKRIKNNPTSAISSPKIHEKEIIRLDINEVSELLDMVEAGEKLTKKQQEYHEKTKIRDLAMLTLMLGTGIRVSECVGLDINDVDFDNCGIKIIRKGGNEVIVYFGDEVENALYDYLEEREYIVAAEGSENALFLSLQKKRMNVRSVEKMVKKYTSLVTPLKKITPHKLRSTYGTTLYQETGDIYLVADVLGHKDVNTTRKHYAAIEDSRRREARNKVKLREE